MGPQMPSPPTPFLACEQAWQVPVQIELQQTPSAQNPLAQSVPEAQVSARLPLSTQVLFRQWAVSMQSKELAQLVAQVLPEHRRRPQSSAPLSAQVPKPLHDLPLRLL